MSHRSSGRARAVLPLLAMSALVGCPGLLGIEEGALLPDAAPTNGPVPDAGASTAADAGDATTADASEATLLRICGDSKGLQQGAPWPTGGACNTRIGRGGGPPLTKPTIAWRYRLGIGTRKEFLTSPIVAADGAIYAVAFDPSDASTYAYALVAVNADGTQRFRAPIAGLTTEAPSIASDGTVYVASYGRLTAIDGVSGESKWEQPIGSGVGSSPTLLPDGTIVVAGSDLYAFRPDSSIRWQRAPPVGRRYRGSVAVHPNGLLVVGEAGDASEGALQLFSPEGDKGTRIPLPSEPVTSPLVSADGRIVVSTQFACHVFTSTGGVDITKSSPGLLSPYTFAVLAGSLVWYNESKGFRPLSLDLASGALMVYDDFGSRTTAFAAASDGTLVFGQRINQKSELALRSPSGTWLHLPLDVASVSSGGAAIGANGTVYLPWGEILYAISDDIRPIEKRHAQAFPTVMPERPPHFVIDR